MSQKGTMLAYKGQDEEIQAYLSRPDTNEPRPAVLVIHEIFGLQDHTRDVADRFAGQGYVAFAPHLFSAPSLVDVMTVENIRSTMQFRSSLNPERSADPAYVQEELALLPHEKQALIQKVSASAWSSDSKDRMTQDLAAAVDYLNQQTFVIPGKVASVGFCFGGGLSINLACMANLAGCVVFYGENPNPVERVAGISCPVLGLYGAEDLRINRRLDELVRAMVVNKKDFAMKIYPGAGHAFFNDTNPNTYREAAARDAWPRVLNFYKSVF
ncbi:MAG TPA: dienelactone hydrolase family protein [Anaerolineaceae bacterium]